MENTVLGERLLEVCKEKNINITELGEKIGMVPGRIYRIAYGSTDNPGVFTMLAICDGLGITLDEFFGTEEFKEFRK